MSPAQTVAVSSQRPTVPRADYDALLVQVNALQRQLDWFKRQLFGAKSEKRLFVDCAHQGDLLAALDEPHAPTPSPPPTERITYVRRKTRADNTVTECGLRFDDSVPVETIILSSPALADVPEDQQLLIAEKISYRLAQRPGSYVILKYVRPVIKRSDTQAIITPAAPSNVLDNSLADVSFLAGMLVDKFQYHLPPLSSPRAAAPTPASVRH